MFSVLAGHLGDSAGTAGHEAHVPDAHYGVQGEGHASASAGAGAQGGFHFPLFSPLALATLFAAVGAYGLMALHGLGVSERLSMGIAVPAAFATAYGITYAVWRVVSSSRGSSAIRIDQIVGALAEVTTPIPEAGMGEVAAILEGQRFSSSAREAAGGAVPRGAQVRVQSVVGSTWIVRKES